MGSMRQELADQEEVRHQQFPVGAHDMPLTSQDTLSLNSADADALLAHLARHPGDASVDYVRRQLLAARELRDWAEARVDPGALVEGDEIDCGPFAIHGRELRDPDWRRVLRIEQGRGSYFVTVSGLAPGTAYDRVRIAVGETVTRRTIRGRAPKTAADPSSRQPQISEGSTE